ncbi:efflux RND transporter permease subunit [Defluviimonas sp. WL0024]|uniref:Efflux RND transporter permease subunit n=1 Tax=Albidovulum salinarum TaxID=2984153 RepID=A0ABT2WZA1_9RHOB|nr:efflux RND transporter permease subunit [Defluviimonas sp. WL0024]MCU9846799.1 efflux RND transporter permease subunit [Defluviimonas sp. WL0024]
MTRIHEAAVRYRLLILVIGVVAMAAGAIEFRRMSVNLLPNLSPTIVEVQTEALGLSAQEVEAMITVPLEADMLNGLPWVDRIDSRSITGLSSIEMVFEPGTDLMIARQMVQERLTAAHALPNVSKPPIMRQPVATDARVVQIGLSSETLSQIDLSVLARWTIRPRLSGVPGVANISIWGERQRQMQVIADPDVLSQNDVLLEDIIRTSGNSMWVSPLSYLNASTPGTGGFIDTPNQRLGIQHVFPIVSPTDMKGLPLTDNPAMSIGDVAEVVEGHQPLIGDALINGKPGLLMVVEKFPWASTSEVARSIERAMAGMKPGLPGVDVNMDVYSAGAIAEKAADRIRLVAAIGAAAALAVIALASRDWRFTAVSGVTAGAAALMSVWLLTSMAGVVSGALMAGLFAAIGMILHDALQAAAPAGAEANDRKRTLLVVTTFAALLAAVPLMFLDGVSGAVAAASVWPYMVAVALSLVAALLVAPALGTLIGGRGFAAAPAFAAGGSVSRMPGLALVALLVAGGAGVVATVNMAAAPNFRNENVLVEWNSAPGTSLEVVMAEGQALSDTLLASDMVAHAALQVGRAEISDEVLNANSGSLWLTLADGVNPAKAEPEIARMVEQAGLAAAVTSYQNRQIARAAPPTANADLLVRVYGHDFNELNAKAQEVTDRLTAIGGISGAELRQTDLEQVVEVEVDLDRAAKYGAKPGDVRRALSALVAGIQVGQFFENQKVFDVVVWGDGTHRGSVEALQTALIDVPAGKVALSDLADVRIASTPAFINRSAVSRFVEIAVTAPSANAALVREVEATLASIDFPLEYHAEVVGGTALASTGGGIPIWQVAVAALIGIVLLMQVALDSWSRAALVTLYAASIGSVAAIAAFALGVWSVAAAIGAVAAFGIGLRDAATAMRFDARDPAMTALFTAKVATIVALAPAILLFAPGLEFVWPASVALVAGLVGAAAMARFILPALAGAQPETALASGGQVNA